MASQNKQEIPSAYEPASVERRLYQRWMDAGYFTPVIDPSKKPFVVIQPPPNVTGELHLGHAQRSTVEDALTRWHRMLGEPTLWLPGVDHAGIATQVVVERELASEGLTLKMADLDHGYFQGEPLSYPLMLRFPKGGVPDPAIREGIKTGR